MLIYGILWVSECLGKIRGGSRDSEKVCAFDLVWKRCQEKGLRRVKMGWGGVMKYGSCGK